MTAADGTTATADDRLSDSSDGPTKVAVACQGGGSHTAFTAGVLTRLLEEPDPDFEVTALTGTSGGALCAFLAWYGLRTDGHDRAVGMLDDLWDDLAATGVGDAVTNAAVVTATAALHAGLPVPQASPAHVGVDEVARARLARAVERHVDPAVLRALVDPADPEPPRVLVSAVAVSDGRFETFSDRPGEGGDGDGAVGGDGDGGEAARSDGIAEGGGASEGDEATEGDRAAESDGAAAGDGDGATGDEARMGDTHGTDSAPDDRLEPTPQPISVDAVLASAAVPTLFEAVEIPDAAGRRRAYWDGLLSQNPPVRNLLSGPETAADKPGEIWLVRINPERRPGRLSGLPEILDRRNELAGSLSLYQELHFVRTVNDWLRAGRFEESFADRLKPVTVRQITLDESRLDPPRRLLSSTKLDRAPDFLADLQRLGKKQAEEFLGDRTAEEHVVVEGVPGEEE